MDITQAWARFRDAFEDEHARAVAVVETVIAALSAQHSPAALRETLHVVVEALGQLDRRVDGLHAVMIGAQELATPAPLCSTLN